MRPTLPWTRQLPNAAADDNPWGSATPPLSSSPGSPAANQRRWSFLNDLMKRADQQESLAESQRKQLQDLRTLQKEQQENERRYVAQQRERERAALAKKFSEKEAEFLDREKRYRGQFDQLHGRASDLDANNRNLHAELARSEQQRDVLQDEIDLLKRRLDETTQQLTQTTNISNEAGRQLQALQASASRRRGNASIRANSSVTRPVTAVMVPGMDIRQDGDLVRIAIPTEKLFMTGTASLHQGSQPYIDQVVNILRQHYPQQIAGVEAHTDHTALSMGNTQWRNPHQLTAAQSMAMFEQLTSRNINPQQLFVLGYGGNHPLVSSGTVEGQSVNRRIEVVVYPETYGRR